MWIIYVYLYQEQSKPRKMDTIKIIGRIKRNKNIFFCNYSPALDEAINNFKEAKTIKVIKGICYIQHISLGYFTEILSRNKVNFSVITTLS